MTKDSLQQRLENCTFPAEAQVVNVPVDPIIEVMCTLNMLFNPERKTQGHVYAPDHFTVSEVHGDRLWKVAREYLEGLEPNVRTTE